MFHFKRASQAVNRVNPLLIAQFLTLKVLGQGSSILELVSKGNLALDFVSNPSYSLSPYPLAFGPRPAFRQTLPSFFKRLRGVRYARCLVSKLPQKTNS